jgi:hypothetical protein
MQVGACAQCRSESRYLDGLGVGSAAYKVAIWRVRSRRRSRLCLASVRQAAVVGSFNRIPSRAPPFPSSPALSAALEQVMTTERYTHVATLQMKDASERMDQAL